MLYYLLGLQYNSNTENRIESVGRRSVMTMEEKMDELMNLVKDMKAQLDKQDEQLEYVVARLNHMREKAHAEREQQTAWPK